MKPARAIDWFFILLLFSIGAGIIIYLISVGYFDPAFEWVREQLGR
jgi:hypothetical protein